MKRKVNDNLRCLVVSCFELWPDESAIRETDMTPGDEYTFRGQGCSTTYVLVLSGLSGAYSFVADT